MSNRASKFIALALMTGFLLSSAVARGRQQRNTSSSVKHQTNVAAAHGSNTAGRIAKFTGENKTVEDSNIFEDKTTGNIAIGATAPTSQLTVNGVIETTSDQGGIKFSDGTLQTTAGLATILNDGTLKGNGTSTSRLGIRVPLILGGAISRPGAVITGFNSEIHGTGIMGVAGPGGEGVDGIGGDADDTGGTGVFANGGRSDAGTSGKGVLALGGISVSGTGGAGVSAQGGNSLSGNPGAGISTTGGISFASGQTGGAGIDAFGGPGLGGAATGAAGVFHGDVRVTGTLSKGGGSFKIDHPLDPENKYLSHSFVESPDMKNIYDGVASLDSNGEAVVELPEWFGALNRDFRYLLTALGGPMPGLYIGEEIANNRFKISGGRAGMRVSWQVTGIRQDAWANRNRIPVEEVKSDKERGHYLHPEAFGQPEERGIDWANQPQVMREIKQRRVDAEQGRGQKK